MSYRIHLHGGPLDGKTVPITNPLPPNDALLEVEPGVVYRLGSWSHERARTDAFHHSAADRIPYTYDPNAGSWVRGESVPDSTRLRASEAVLAVVVFGTFGAAVGLGLGIIALIGYGVGITANATGGWVNFALITAGVWAGVGLVAAVARPSIVRDRRR